MQDGGAKLDPAAQWLYIAADRIVIRNNEGYEMARAPILAAGGIVTQRSSAPLIAVVRLRKRNEWVLPKGKLDAGETARAAAEREVLEETGHRVSVHEFLGTLAYDVGGRPKVVHYWRMEAEREPSHALMNDVTAVAWLPLDEALERLTRGHERAFLAEVGPLAIEAAAVRAAPVRRRAPAKRAAPPPRPAATPAAKVDGDRPVMADEVADAAPDAAPAEEREKATEVAEAVDMALAMGLGGAIGIADAMDIAEADSPALAPTTREYPVAPRSANPSKTLLEKAWLWLRGRS
jgi:8-oxo-dGTP diphosphatase